MIIHKCTHSLNYQVMLVNYPQHWGLSGVTLPWSGRALRFLLKRIRRHKHNGVRRKVLLAAHNYLMLLKMMEVVNTIESNGGISWYCTSTRAPNESTELIRQIEEFNLTYVHPYSASLRIWDLVMVADHGVIHHFNSTIPTLLVHHGLGDAKILLDRDERYQYAARNVLGRNEEPLYTCMLESSEHRKSEAVAKIPSLQDRIAVVGHIEVDALLELENDRNEIRWQWGYDQNDIVVFIGSSHGDNSLFDSLGHVIVNEALQLPEHYKFILWAHHNNWQCQRHNTPSIGESLRQFQGERVRICEPGDDLLSHIVATDIGLTDFTSASLYFAILDRPVVYVPIPKGVVSKKSELWRLYSSVPKVERPSEIRTVIDHVQKSYPMYELRKIGSELVSYPGEAKHRIGQELSRVLKLYQR